MHSKHVVVLGRSSIVGLPLSLLLLHQHATLSNCHRLTPLATTRSLCQQADVIISAAGSPLLIKRDWVKPGAVLLDVGINFISQQRKRKGQEEGRAAANGRLPEGKAGEEEDEEGEEGSASGDGGEGSEEDERAGLRLVGDVDLESVRGHAGAVSPVPGGIGPMTVACLMSNTLNNFLRSQPQQR